MSSSLPRGVSIKGPLKAGYSDILTPDCLTFLAELHRNFQQQRQGLLNARVKRQAELDSGKLPDFLPETANIRQGVWKGPPIPADLQDRRVEITGPVDRKMVINALNSGAKVYMADFEDSTAPTWDNLLQGQINLKDAVNGTISFTNPAGKQYKVVDKPAVLFVRPRGWHLNEAHLIVDGLAMSGSLFDFGVFFFHNAEALIKKGSGPYFYLPKMESHKEARLWNDVFLYSQKRLGIPVGTIRATVLIETILAAFEMDEIIYELREHSAGLNCGRWDYIFSTIKKFRHNKKFVLPDRSQVTMSTPFMASYVRLLIQTCHKRGVHAMGGMAAQIPIPNNEAANKAAFDKVEQDKLQEVKRGHDGTWVAHPALIPVAFRVFNEYMKTPNQIASNPGDSRPVSAADLLDLGPKGTITKSGIESNVDVGIGYTEAWLRGVGCVPLHNLMEDAATAEISRCQLWHWIRHQAKTSDGTTITKEFILETIKKEGERIKSSLGEEAFNKRQYNQALKIYGQMIVADNLDDFLTLVCYPFIIDSDAKVKAKF